MPEARGKGPGRDASPSTGTVVALEPRPGGSLGDPTDVMPEGYSEAELNLFLSRRPAISIRTRLILAFAFIFALCAGITLWSIFALSEVQVKIHFLEVAANWMTEIQQARRFEKNYLLYGTNLEDALDHLQRAEKSFEVNRPIMEKILKPAEVLTMGRHLADYHQLLLDLGRLRGAQDKRDVEPALREHGAQMVSFAEDFVRKERESVDSMLLLARRIPFFFLGLLLISMVLSTTFLARQLLGALARFMEYTRRIGEGDFTPITPRRKYRDEFSQLAMAFNHMIHELDRRHRILVESHKLRAVGTLVAGVAHELNNPLNNTMLTASVLAEDLERLSDAEKQELVQDLISETERAQKIVRNLLDFARESEVNVKPLDVQQILENSVRLVANQVRMARVTLRTDFSEELPPIHGDEQLLQQVFVNLILNAVDVLPEKGVITLSTPKNRENGYVVVELRDNGPGIPEHILPRIFEPFFTTKARGKGTGLGLSVSQGIIRKHGGYIRVESRAGAGTCFTVLLPITDVPSLISSA